jgi:benzoyl-CoA 2,3-dioxygenase component A
MDVSEIKVIKQHLIDPEICIRCNTCEVTCPVHAISHDSNNYVVDAEVCNLCMACISPCPTGSIDNWRLVPKARAYSIEEQLGWDELPAELGAAELAEAGVTLEAAALEVVEATVAAVAASGEAPFNSAQFGAQIPPWSAAHAYTNLYGPKAAEKTITATVTGNVRVTEVGKEYASPRNGERPGYNNLSLTIKRVLEDHQGNPVRGVASNYMCDLEVGDKVEVIGPFGASFLMPNHPRSHIVMICTGTGSAPMRAMTEWRRRLRASGKFEGGKLMLFFGARTKEELPYFGPLQSLPKDFMDTHFAFSRTPGQPKTYVQDLMRERAADVAKLLADPDSHFYVCGLKSMEEGVVLALRDIAQGAGLNWESISAALKRNGRLHLETY